MCDIISLLWALFTNFTFQIWQTYRIFNTQYMLYCSYIFTYILIFMHFSRMEGRGSAQRDCAHFICTRNITYWYKKGDFLTYGYF